MLYIADQENGYTIEVFRDGETIDVVSVPQSWVTVLPESWGNGVVKERELRMVN